MVDVSIYIALVASMSFVGGASEVTMDTNILKAWHALLEFLWSD